MIKLIAPAKINLFFNILDKRLDGYHNIESIVVFAKDIYDELELIPCKKNMVTVEGGEFAHELTEKNILEHVQAKYTKNQNYRCKLVKNIPVAAGLGGGSADAAALARFLFNNKELDEKLAEEIAKMGADLPICYLNKPSICWGIGEKIKKIINFPIFYVVLVNPKKKLLTKDVFANLKLANKSEVILDEDMDFKNDLEFLIHKLQYLKNDLTETSILLLDEVRLILNLLNKQENCKLARMSGSGPTCFGIFEDYQSAAKAYEEIKSKAPDYWVKITKIEG